MFAQIVVKEIKLLDITYAAGVEKLDKEEREVKLCVTVTVHHSSYWVCTSPFDVKSR